MNALQTIPFICDGMPQNKAEIDAALTVSAEFCRSKNTNTICSYPDTEQGEVMQSWVGQRGLMSASELREIADMLDRMNSLNKEHKVTENRMIDLRWYCGTLQFRQRTPVCDASGAICGFGDWEPWQDVGGDAVISRELTPDEHTEARILNATEGAIDAYSDRPKCELCGKPMPPGEEMFKFHGYCGPRPQLPLPLNTGVAGEIPNRRERIDPVR